MADDNDDDLYESVSAMAKRIGLSGRERERYIHEHMTRSGYRAVPQYVRDDEDEREEEESGFFGRGRRGRDRDREEEDRPRRSRPRSRDREGDDWYS